jgi:hypothetical protein
VYYHFIRGFMLKILS